MASMNEVMNHKNKDPKWMTENEDKQQGGEKQGKNGGQNNNNNNNNNTNKASKAPAIPRYDFNVKMCCPKCEEKAREEAYEVAGVSSVVIDRGHSRVTVHGDADAASLLRKMKRHIDKKATLLPPEAAKGESGGKGGGKGDKGGDHESEKGENKGKAQKSDNNNNNNNNGGGGGGGGGNGGGEKKKKGGGGDGQNQGGENGHKNNGGGGGDGEPNPQKGNNKEGQGGNKEGKGNNNNGNQKEMEYPPMTFRENSYDYRGGFDPRGGPSREPYYQDFQSAGEAYPRGYQPKESYFSDYRPSQSYPANFRSYDNMNQPITNPNYMKHIMY